MSDRSSSSSSSSRTSLATPHSHRWVNTALAILAGLTAFLTAATEHRAIRVEPVRCDPPGLQGTVPSGLSGVASHP